MENQKDDFTLKNYSRCILLGLQNNYNFLNVGEYFKRESSVHEKQIILRHDIDTQLDVAIKMAEIEKMHGVNSTYFIRLHSHNYNPLCLRDYEKIKKIISLGHEIGLHYESDFYNIIGNEIKYFLNKEIELLENIFDIKVSSICPHEPTRTNVFHLKDIKYFQSYDSKLLKDFKYISDSSCRWRDGSFYENINQGHKRLYVLTHPYWWYNQSPIENY